LKSEKFLGLVGAVGIWLTSGFAVPFVNVLHSLTAEQLMIFRGFITALMALIVLRGRIGQVDKYTWFIGLTVPLATLGFYHGIRHWGAGPTLIIITTTPVVNLIIGYALGRTISRAVIIGLILMLVGVAMARHGGHFHWKGLAWSILATIMSGIIFELFARTKSSSMQTCFFAFMGMGIVGLVASFQTSFANVADMRILASLVAFAFIGGFLYWCSNILAFKNLPTTEAAVLAQGETPAVLIGAYLMLGERLSFVQWTGVGISLFGAYYLSRKLAPKKK